MPRPASVEVGGFYAFPPHLLPALCRLLHAESTGTYGNHSLVLLDPCAGEGVAVAALARQLAADADPNLRATVIACELEAGRATALRDQLVGRLPRVAATVLHADAFTLVPASRTSSGAHALYLNPPYGFDRAHGRLEHRWLARFTPLLLPGEGVLLFVVPHYALSASADYLARHYDDVACYRLPDPDFAAFRQVVLVGRRATVAASDLRASLRDADAARIAAWAGDVGALPVLGEGTSGALTVQAGVYGALTLEASRGDLTGLMAAVKPWQVGDGDRRTPLAEVGMDKGIRDIIGQPYPVAMPPKPAHLALALASGAFNGKRIAPNDPARGLPDLLLKGVFTREYKTLAENTDADGEVTSAVQVQQPRLQVTALALGSYTYHELKAGTTPTGATTVADMTMADVMAGYGESLTALMETQFPPLHNPLDDSHQVALPALGRALYGVQRQAVQVGLKLLAQGVNPFLISEVGTGKSAMSSAMAAALSPPSFGRTVAELARVGCRTDGLRPVSNVLVMCPPHLLDSWRDELRAVLPGARAIVVERFADFDAPVSRTSDGPGAGMTFYILSRERAKLGSGLRGGAWRLSGERRCPQCGGEVADPEPRLVSGRLRCERQGARAANPAAELARDLGALLAPLYPSNRTVVALTPGRIQAHARARLAARLLAAAEEQHDPDVALRHAKDAWRRPSRRFWRRRLLLRLATEAATLVDRRHEYERTGRTLAALVKLAAALPDAERVAPPEGERRRPPPEQQGALLPHLAGRLVAAAARDADGHGNGALLCRAACELLLLHGADTAVERAHCGDRDEAWGELARVRSRLARERQAVAAGRAPAPNPDAGRTKMTGNWARYTVDEEGRLRLGEFPVGAPEAAAAALEDLMQVAHFTHAGPCGEFLYQATPEPRRYPLARHILRRRRRMFGLVVLDEVQELGHAGTAQEKAGHRLVGLPGVPVVTLTGSLMNGYASTLFPNYWALSARFRRDFARADKQRFIDRFGYRKRLVLRGDGRESGARVAGYGSMSDREELVEDASVRQLGEAPGLLPLFVLLYLLPEAVLVHKSELDHELPPLVERPIYVTFSEGGPDAGLRAGYTQLKDALVGQIQADRGTERAGKLWGAMSEMPSYLDLGTADTGNCRVDGAARYQARYPGDCGGALVCDAPLISSLALTPKERWLMRTVRAELDEGRSVLLFVRHTKGSGLPARLQRLLARELGETAAFLDADKVGAERRQAWINAEVVARRQRILIVNPNAVKTGLNNLVFASTAIWHELDHSAITYRQANGRLHRIGQTKEVRIYYPVFQDTVQEIARDLLAAKVTASLQTDGLEMRSTLQSLGASDEEDTTTLAMSIGQGIYQRLTRGYTLARRGQPTINGEVVAEQTRPLPAPPRPSVPPRALPPRAPAHPPVSHPPAASLPLPASAPDADAGPGPASSRPVAVVAAEVGQAAADGRMVPLADLASVRDTPVPVPAAPSRAHRRKGAVPEGQHSFFDLFA